MDHVRSNLMLRTGLEDQRAGPVPRTQAEGGVEVDCQERLLISAYLALPCEGLMREAMATELDPPDRDSPAAGARMSA